MIYFDNNKNAHMQEIETPLCTVTDEQWQEFCFLTLGKDYDITTDGIVDLRQTQPYVEAEIARLKAEKHAENQRKLDIARTSHVFTVILQDKECVFDTKDKTQNDLNSAAISATLGQPWVWTTNNRITLLLTAEDVQTVATAYSQAVNEDILKWAYYDESIELAENIEELESIEIEY